MRDGVSEETLSAIIEAYLFETGKEVTVEEIMDLFNGVFSVFEIESLLEKIEQRGWEEGRGVVLICRNGFWALETRGSVALFEKLNINLNFNLKRNENDDLGNMREGEKTVLAIIAHEGPVHLGSIEKIMSSECGHFLLSLRERGLVKKRPGNLK